MKEEMARAEFPNWANKAVRIVDEDDGPVLDRKWKHEQPSQRRRIDWDRLVKRYGIFVAGASLFTLYTIVLSWCVHAGAVKQVRADMEIEYAARLEEYKAEQARAVQAEHWLSGEASREAFVNQAIEIGAKSAGAKEMKTDVQKGGVIMTEIARMMNPAYPDTIQGVVGQEGQIPFYSEDNTYTLHDKEIAEKLLRPFLEEGIVPNGLTQDYVYAEWTPTDYILRDAWIKDSNAHYLRYGG